MSLKSVRTQIAKVTAEIEAVKNALPPVELIEARVSDWMAELLQPKQQIVDRLAGCFSRGDNIGFLFELPQRSLINAAIGLGLAGIGIDKLIEEAKQKALAEDTGALRMTAAERTEKLDSLLRELYDLELQEEQILDGEPRRENIYFPAAVLQIPVDVAANAGLLK